MSSTTQLPIRVAIVGCGGISSAHGRAVAAHHDRVAWAACADIVPASAERFAKACGVPAVYTDYRRMIEKEKPELAIIATWPPLHEEQVLQSIALGVPNVLCEKSLAMSAASAARMARAAQAAGARLFEGVMCRHHPRMLELVRLVEQGKIGTLRSIRSGFSRIVGTTNEGVYKRNVELGGGVVYDFTCYAVNALGAFTHVLPERVYGVWKRADDGLIEELTGLLEYPDGVIAHVESSFLRSYRQPLELHGEAGVLRVEDAWTPGDRVTIEFLDLRRPGVPQSLPAAAAAGHTEQLAHLCDCIRNDAPPRFTIEESVRNHAVLDALLESAEKGCPVAPKLPDEG